MKHDLQAFSRDIAALIKTSGDSGGSGDKVDNSLQKKDYFVPTRETEVSPLKNEWGQPRATSGDIKAEQFESVMRGVPTVPTATTNFQQGRASQIEVGAPADWHAILVELNRCEPVEWLSAERWFEVIDDAEAFISRWGNAAEKLGWTALDLFGVHPTAPASRFDVMGLVLFINGGAVVALTDGVATIRRRSNAILTYRRSCQPAALLISELAASQ